MVVWYAGFGEFVKLLAISFIGCARLPLFKANTVIPPINKTIFSKAIAEPPTDVILVICSTPFVDIYVTIIIQITASIPKLCVEFNPNIDHSAVLSYPNIALDKGIHIEEDTFTIQTI